MGLVTVSSKGFGKEEKIYVTIGDRMDHSTVYFLRLQNVGSAGIKG